MIYTYEAVKEAIGIILPQFITLVENGIEHNVPKWLEMCAVEHFMTQYPDDDRRDIEKQEAYFAVHSALKDLKEKGMMVEGTMVLQFRKEK